MFLIFLLSVKNFKISDDSCYFSLYFSHLLLNAIKLFIIQNFPSNSRKLLVVKSLYAYSQNFHETNWLSYSPILHSCKKVLAPIFIFLQSSLFSHQYLNFFTTYNCSSKYYKVFYSILYTSGFI